MSLRRRAVRERQENNLRDVDQLLGLWKSSDDSDRVLIRVRRAVTGEYYNGVDNMVSLFGDLVKFERILGSNDVGSFPKILKMHLPNRDTYIRYVQVKFGRSKFGGSRSVVIRGRLVRTEVMGCSG
jgi:hypothetical protein